MTINVKKALYSISYTWHCVTSDTIRNCWAHIGILLNCESLISVSCNNGIDASVAAEVSQQIGKMPFDCSLPTEEFIDIDMNEPTSRSMKVDKIIDFVMHSSMSVLSYEDSESEYAGASGKNYQKMLSS